MKTFINKHLKKIKKIFDRYVNVILSILNPQSPRVYLSVNDKNKEGVDVIVVAFNDLGLIQYQYGLMKKYLTNYREIICDNSNDESKSEAIYHFCIDNDITYIKVPHFMFESPSHNHGRALNWIMRNVVKKNKRDFMFLDHDMFPFKKIDLKHYLQKPFFGRIREENQYWFLTPIICGFNFNSLINYKTDFLPSFGRKHAFLDTGGGNYFTIYRYLKRDDVKILSVKKYNIKTKEYYEEERKNEEVYSDEIEFIDDRWLHIQGGSCWGGKHNKFEQVKKLMDELQ